MFTEPIAKQFYFRGHIFNTMTNSFLNNKVICHSRLPEFFNHSFGLRQWNYLVCIAMNNKNRRIIWWNRIKRRDGLTNLISFRSIRNRIIAPGRIIPFPEIKGAKDLRLSLQPGQLAINSGSGFYSFVIIKQLPVFETEFTKKFYRKG